VRNGDAVTEWLTLDELATYLKRGRSTLYRMAQRGELPASKIGRTWRFERGAIDEWLRQQSPKLPAGKAKRKRQSIRRDAQ
jgi:excisionase family DNA binding protein